MTKKTKRVNTKLNNFLRILCLLILVSLFLPYLSCDLSLRNDMLRGMLSGVGVENGRLNLTAYRIIDLYLQSNLNIEQFLIDYIAVFRLSKVIFGIPYVWSILMLLLSFCKGRKIYAFQMFGSLAIMGAMLFDAAVRYPTYIGVLAKNMLGIPVVALLESIAGTEIEGFFRTNILRFMQPGYWLIVVVLGIMSLVSLIKLIRN